jgi:hypothetical protein
VGSTGFMSLPPQFSEYGNMKPRAKLGTGITRGLLQLKWPITGGRLIPVLFSVKAGQVLQFILQLYCRYYYAALYHHILHIGNRQQVIYSFRLG